MGTQLFAMNTSGYPRRSLASLDLQLNRLASRSSSTGSALGLGPSGSEHGRDLVTPRRGGPPRIAEPHDRQVADGDLVTLDVLKPETPRAYKAIAAAIVDGYR